MITIREAEEILKKEYHIDNFTYMVEDLILPDYVGDIHVVAYSNNVFSSVKQLGYSKDCDLYVYEVILEDGAQNRRVKITQEMFRILRGQGINNALVAFSNADGRNYRLSLLTSKYEFEGDKIVKVLSNPRRYSYSLGYGTKTKTAYDFLISKGKVHSLDELISRFSIEIVNKHFYNEIALSFTRLIGGKRDNKVFDKELELYGVTNQNKYAEFAVRLIGRIVFCWFLKEKKSEAGIPLIPEDMLSLSAIAHSTNYYHDVLEPLFFELLNTHQNRRKTKFAQNEYYNQIPYLNGGLFSPHADDKYNFDNVMGTGRYGVVTIPNEWFEHFFEILTQYNFTVDENTSYDIELSIDPEMLGRIFENLLAEINPETGENAKKSTGSFYTPRDIVDYMVDNSILEYLKTKTNIDEERLKAIISYSKEDDDIAQFSLVEKKSIINALYKITVLDPACGSGAFPIGMLQKIVYILQEVDHDADMWFDEIVKGAPIYVKKAFEEKFSNGELDYIRKLTVIEKSIYGVDIQPIAVEISRLRCFLSLVIEQKVKDNLPNRGVHPLPSLDFKFLIANTLIPLPDETSANLWQKVEQISMLENIDHIEELRAVREEYFNADNERKAELREEFGNIQKKMFQQTISYKGASKRYAALADWSPFKNEPTDWFDAEWMFGVNDGFDVVIGNPPYIQLQKAISNTSTIKLGDIYQKCGFSVFEKTGDIYCLFYEKGVNMLKKDGILTYITSNKWMRAGYGEKLRGYLAKHTNPLLLLDFCGQKVFDTATVDVNILLLSKQQNKGRTIACTANERCRDNLSVFVEQNRTISDFRDSGNWTILTEIEQNIKRKIEQYGTPLKDWGVNIYRGILTGFNEAFIIDEETKNELISTDPKSAEIIRPILRGRDIKRYAFDFAHLYLINTHNGIKDKGIAPIDVSQYPAVKAHLDKYYEQLEKRQDKGDTPYNLRNCVYTDDFSNQKIMYSEIVQKPQFYLDEGVFYPEATTFIMCGDNLDFLTCCLNSTICFYIFKKYYAGGGLGENGVRYKKQFILNLPIPKNFSNNEFSKYLKHKEIEIIEKKIIELYHLTPSEVRILLSN